MGKLPSAATQLRTAKRDIKTLQLNLDAVRRLLDEYRIRASKAEQECAEWKVRFDLLLRQPATPAPAWSVPYAPPSPADPLPALPTITCKE